MEPPVDKGFVVGVPVGYSELLLCHGAACVVRDACSDPTTQQKLDLFNKAYLLYFLSIEDSQKNKYCDNSMHVTPAFPHITYLLLHDWNLNRMNRRNTLKNLFFGLKVFTTTDINIWHYIR